jgi:hypothetical protein
LRLLLYVRCIVHSLNERINFIASNTQVALPLKTKKECYEQYRINLLRVKKESNQISDKINDRLASLQVQKNVQKSIAKASLRVQKNKHVHTISLEVSHGEHNN